MFRGLGLIGDVKVFTQANIGEIAESTPIASSPKLHCNIEVGSIVDSIPLCF